MKNIIKNNKKNLESASGFTLIELLGVLILLAVIALITYPIIDKVLSNAKSEAYERQKDSIIDAARMYVTTNGNYSTSTKQLSFETLIDVGFLKEGEILDPRDSSKNMPGCILYNWSESTNQYIFEYSEECKIVYAVGDLLKVQVGASETQNIYVLEVNDNEITGILDRNLGDAVEWISQEDYNAEGGNWDSDSDEIKNKNLYDFGPVTANKALMDRTNSWINAKNIKLPNVADLLKFTEFYQTLDDKTNWENMYISRTSEQLWLDGLNSCNDAKDCYEVFTSKGYSDILLPEWLIINLYTTGDKSSLAYWTSTPTNYGMVLNPNQAWFVYDLCHIQSVRVEAPQFAGIRPIITISNSKVLEKLDSPEYVNP